MKKTALLLFAFMVSLLAVAQQKQKRFQFEVGLNAAYPLHKAESPRPKVMGYLNSTYRLPQSPLSIKLKLSLDAYKYKALASYWLPAYGVVFLTDVEMRALSVIPSLNYNWALHRHVTLYAGLGLGVSFSNYNTGVFNEGFKTHLNLAPQVGVELFKHLNLSAQCNFTHKYSSRLVFNLGYLF